MNLFPSPSERDQEFKAYLSQYKATAKALDTSATTRTFNEQMRMIIEKFPYFEHTTARIMAVAMHMAVSANPNASFNIGRASTLLDTAFANLRTDKDKSLLLIDTARYYKRLLDPT